jgi:5-carboxymethyl-2-hydroxymuconate isomerase
LNADAFVELFVKIKDSSTAEVAAAVHEPIADTLQKFVAQIFNR